MDMMENSGHCYYSRGLLRDYEVCAEVRCKLYSKCHFVFFTELSREICDKLHLHESGKSKGKFKGVGSTADWYPSRDRQGNEKPGRYGYNQPPISLRDSLRFTICHKVIDIWKLTYGTQGVRTGGNE